MTKLLRIKEVKNHVGLSKSEIYRLISMNKFPKPIRLGDRAVAWTDESIMTWIEDKIQHEL